MKPKYDKTLILKHLIYGGKNNTTQYTTEFLNKPQNVLCVLLWEKCCFSTKSNIHFFCKIIFRTLICHVVFRYVVDINLYFFRLIRKSNRNFLFNSSFLGVRSQNTNSYYKEWSKIDGTGAKLLTGLCCK